MKNFSFNSVKSFLSRDEMRRISGGQTQFSCYCGFEGGGHEHLKIYVEADNVGDTLNSMNCGGLGATCNGA